MGARAAPRFGQFGCAGAPKPSLSAIEAAGSVQVGENDVRLQVTLPWLLHKFGQVVQKTIAGKGQILLEKK